MDLNKVTLIGRLTREPEGKEVNGGQSLARFGLATNYIWRDFKSKEKKEQSEFHEIVAWGKLAEIVNTYLKKGARIYLEGRLKTNKWQDKDNNTRKTTAIIADEIIMLGHKSNKATDKSEIALAKEEPSEQELVVENV